MACGYSVEGMPRHHCEQGDHRSQPRQTSLESEARAPMADGGLAKHELGPALEHLARANLQHFHRQFPLLLCALLGFLLQKGWNG